MVAATTSTMSESPPPDIEQAQGESVTLTLSKQLLEEAIVDALRLDYEGKLAKICDAALTDNESRLLSFVHRVIGEVSEDEAFAESLREMIRKKLRDRLGAKLDGILKRMTADQLDLLFTKAARGD